MITYNHERFIEQAIESVLMQETDFPVELVIGEDCSTDNTRTIVMEYAQRYPNRIRLLLPDRNLGMIPNFVATLQVCAGQYIALLEGDDYWTDAHKLQKQVDFLESHPESTLCLHDVLVVFEDGRRPSYRHSPAGRKPQYVLEDVLGSALSQTASLVFRNGLLSDLPDWFLRAPIGDWALSVLLAVHGSIGYLDEVMSVWRNHTGGVWNGSTERERLKQSLQMYDLFDAHLGYRYTAILEPFRAVCYYGLALDCWLRGLQEEQNRWLALVIERFPQADDPLFIKVIGTAQEVESSYGYQTADDAVNWICDSVGMQPMAATWCRKLRGEWYSGYAYKAHQRSDNAAVRRSSWRAIRSDWRILRNRGFVRRWFSAMPG